MLGLALLIEPALAIRDQMRRDAVAEKLSRFGFTCDRTTLEVHNNNRGARHVQLEDVQLQGTVTSLEQDTPTWPVKLEPSSADLAAGASVRLTIVPPTSGPCARPPGIVVVPLLVGQPACYAVSFRIVSGAPGTPPDLDATASCRFGDASR